MKLLILVFLSFSFCCYTQTIYDYQFIDINGDTIYLKQYKNKVIYINVWQTYCEPCIDEIPMLNKLKDSHSSIKFLSITPALKKKCEKTLKKHPINFSVICDADSFCKQMKVFRYPAHIIITKEGKIERYEPIIKVNRPNEEISIDEKVERYLKLNYLKLDSTLITKE